MVTGIVRSSTLMREPVVDRANCQLNGHLALDRAIAAIDGLLRSQLRCSDHAARWGGEEFVVALTSTGAGGGLARPRLGDRLVFDGVDGMVISTSLDRIETRDASGLVTAENGEDVATWRRKRA